MADADAAEAKGAVKQARQKEIGLTGTVNYAGMIHSESNSRLMWEQAYGSPGGTSWGEWEKLARTDSAVASALDLIAAPLRDASVEVEPGSEDEESIKIADFVRDNLQEWLEPSWPAVIEQMTKGALAYGFSIHEIVWGTRQDERVPGGLAVVASKLAQRLPSSVKQNGWIERNGDLFEVIQSGTRGGAWMPDVHLPASKILLASWNREGDNYQGFSAFRSVWYLGTIRAELLKILAMAHERESKGVPVVVQDREADLTPKQMEDLQSFMENMVAHENAAMVLPKLTTLEWVHAPSGNKGQVMQSYRELGLCIFEAVQAQQTYLGTSGTGSRAVGEVHDASKNGFVNGVRAFLEGVFNGVGSRAGTGLVPKLVDANFGPQRRYPKLRLVISRSEIPPTEFANAMKTLADGGIITVTGEDENVARQRIGLPPIDAEVRDAEKAKKSAIARAISGLSPESGEEEDDAEDEAEQEEEADNANASKGAAAKETPALAKPLAKAGKRKAVGVVASRPSALSDVTQPFFPRRSLRTAEQHLALSEMNAFHTSARMEFERDVRDILGDMVRAALPAIKEAMADGDPSELASLNLPSGLLAKAVEVFIERARGFGYRQAMLEKKRQPDGLLAKRQAGQSGVTSTAFAERLERVFTFAEEGDGDGSAPDVDPDEPTPRPKQKVDKLVKAQAALVTKRIKTRVQGQIIDTAVDAVRRGETADDILDELMEVLEESKALRTDAGMVVARAFSMGREQFIAEHASEVSMMQYSAILDTGTCEPCEQADGTEFEVGSPEHDEMLPPYRLCDGANNCRCLLVALYDRPGFQTQEVDE